MPIRNLLYREFGLLLAGERKRKGLSQAEFGALVGLSRTSVTNIECGRQPIQLHQLFSFASILRIEVSKLLPKEPPSTHAVRLNEMKRDELARFLEEARKLLNAGEKPSQEGSHG